MEEKKQLQSPYFSSYQALIAEAHRASGPRWVRFAFLALHARQFFAKECHSYSQFVEDAGLAQKGETLATWVRAFAIYEAIPARKRRHVPELEYYLTAARHPKYNSGAWTAQEAFDWALKTNAGMKNLYNGLKGATGAANVLAKHPGMIEDMNPNVVAQFMRDSKIVRDVIREHVGGRRKVAV